MLELLLPRTDAGVAVQIAMTLLVGVPLLRWTIRRRLNDLSWFVGGGMVLAFGIFAIRTVH